MAAAVALAAAIFTFTFVAGAAGSAAFAVAAAAAGAGAAATALLRRFPLDPRAASRPLKILSAAAAVLALVQLGRLAVFMVDGGQTRYSWLPASAWETRHSCLTAYFVAAEAAGNGGDVFDGALYTAADDDKSRPRRPRMLGPFVIDVYEYPPPFLVLPRAARLLTSDFTRTRALWFGLNGAAVLAAMLLVAARLGPEAGTRAALLVPLAWAGIPMANLMQKGNVQALVVTLAIAGMVLLERRRFVAGAAALAFATASKLFPGVLVVYLLARRQWRAVAWTAAMGIVFALAALVDLGWRPYAAFVSHLPLLMSGEAFPALRNPAAVAMNYSVPGLVFKARLFGVPGMGFTAAKVVGWLYTALLLWVIFGAARRRTVTAFAPLVWLAIVVLGTLRSPFLPQAYAPVPPLWLLTLLAATYVPTTRVIALAVSGWMVFNVYWPNDWRLDPAARILAIALPQALTVAVVVMALRRGSPAPAEEVN